MSYARPSLLNTGRYAPQTQMRGGVNWQTGASVAPPPPALTQADPDAAYQRQVAEQAAINAAGNQRLPPAQGRRSSQPSTPAPPPEAAPAPAPAPAAAPEQMAFGRPPQMLDPGTGWADLTAPSALQPNLGQRLPRQATEALRSLRMGGGLY